MSMLKRSSSDIDPSNFLWALKRIISEQYTAFNYNTQQDVPEILHTVLDKLKGSSSRADYMSRVTTTSTVTLDTCFCSSSREDTSNILTLPTSLSISQGLLKPESLSGEYKWFRPQCNTHRECTKETHISHCGSVLIVQLLKFSAAQNTFVKDTRSVDCSSESENPLNVQICSNNDISFNRNFSLVATINHSGTIKSGHYWAKGKIIYKEVVTNCNQTARGLDIFSCLWV
ncbi:ubiquitin carboxyl-terminal hydrolase 27-like [Hydractinia symbiolongicarpus]|uniref:ubiquitin carboxyl-terminal hydrolase 27-like n=1 Tax=Hydractinia symbiolongicarpus TaxID=13093 RepID=UPI0025516106|nr:ubiquitin carboxyl-terminal hydrolase 27-like [Hydractinia symbiolongicarpus]